MEKAEVNETNIEAMASQIFEKYHESLLAQGISTEYSEPPFPWTAWEWLIEQDDQAEIVAWRAAAKHALEF